MLQEFKRPSIVNVSMHPLVIKHSSRPDDSGVAKERHTSTGSDEGYNSRLLDTLKKKEEFLAERERVVVQKEKDLDRKLCF